MWSAPTTTQREFSLEFGTTRFRVDPSVGGRIVEFSARGENVLCPLDDLGDWTNGGSTFWTSPQSAWGWPPNPLVDRAEYSAALDESAERLALTSPPFELSGSKLTVKKRFWPDVARDAVVIEYSVQNQGPAISLAGWEVSRVAATGRSFCAGKNLRALGGLPSPGTTQGPAGWIWMDHAEQLVEAKLGADAALGFVGYATPRLLFVKTFESEPNEVAPGEAQIELYVKPHNYVEIEQQGPYRQIAPGQELSYRVTWYIRSLEAARGHSVPGSGTPSHDADWVAITRQLLDQEGSRA